MIMQRTRLDVMKNWLRVHDWPAKKPYMIPVSVIVSAYMPAVYPTRIHCQIFGSEFSEFWRQISVHEWAKSARRARPMRMKTVSPSGATQLPQKMKKPLGMNEEMRMRTAQILGPHQLCRNVQDG